MLKAPPFRLEGALNRRRNCERLQRKSKKILNRGNEPKDLLETQHLAVFWSEKRTQNELDFECKKRLSKRKSRFRVPGSRCQVQEEQVSGVRCQVSGVRAGRAGGKNREQGIGNGELAGFFWRRLLQYPYEGNPN